VLPRDSAVPVAELKPDLKAKPSQDRFVSSAMDGDAQPQPAKSTKTAEAEAAAAPTGGVATTAQPQN